MASPTAPVTVTPSRTGSSAAGSSTAGSSTAASASISGLAAGTYTVGFCVQNNGAQAIDSNDYVNGWVIVTN